MNEQQAVSAGHQKTLDVAKDILLEGGNAFDAAVAAGFAMFATEPGMASAGAGGFAMCHSPGNNPIMLDFFTQTPRNKPDLPNRNFYPIHVNFGNEIEEFHIGLASCAVPGTIGGLYSMHDRFGTIPINELMQPARKLAKEGVILDKFTTIDLQLLEPTFRVDPTVKHIFFKGDILKTEGDLLQFPKMGGFFDFLETDGCEGFYKGEIGMLVDKDCRDKGGYLRRDDFENYKAVWRQPLTIPWHNHLLWLPNGPSLGGAIMALVFAYLDKTGGDWGRTISEVKSKYQHPIEIAQRLEVLHPELNFHLEGPQISSKGTSHFNVTDRFGNAVSLTTSLGEGSGYFIPETNLQMNNMMGESFLLPKGFHSWEPNARLNSMMTPTMLTDANGKFRYAGGSGGAGRIPFMIAQVIKYIFDNKLDLLSATKGPRIHVHEGTLHFEKGAEIDPNSFAKIKEWDYESLFFGGVHSIFRGIDNHLEAVGDSRRFGVSEVF